jgi:hypothetical protein
VNEDYRKAVIDAIVAAGHTVTHGSRGLMIDDEYSGVPASFGPGSKVTGAIGGRADNFQSVWRARKLPDDPDKAATMLLERHKEVLASEAREKVAKDRIAARHTQQKALLAAFDVPGAAVSVVAGGAVFSFHVNDATPELAAKLAAAIRGAL